MLASPIVLERFKKFKDFIRNGINIIENQYDTQSIRYQNRY